MQAVAAYSKLPRERSDPQWEPTGIGNNRISDRWTSYQQGRRNATVRELDINDALALMEPPSDEAQSRKKSRSLLQSLKAGDEIEAGPTIDVRKAKGGSAEAIDSDGWHRLNELKKAGVQRVPVSFVGIGDGADVKEIVGMTGKIVPFDFRTVPTVPRDRVGPDPRFNPYEAAKREASEMFARMDKAVGNWDPQRRQVFELNPSRILSLYASGQIEAGIAARRNGNAAELLADAADHCEAAEMGLYAACARWLRGRLVGGTEGRRLTDLAKAWMAAQGVVRPDRTCMLLVPGIMTAPLSGDPSCLS